MLSHLNSSFAKAEKRFGKSSLTQRSDRGQSRLPLKVQQKLRQLFLGQERPQMHKLLAKLKDYCELHGLRVPARASVYNYMKICPAHQYAANDLPQDLRNCLYNVDLEQKILGPQLVFYAFHYGNMAAVSQASALPWLDLYQAGQRPAWRARSRGLFHAVLLARGISK